MNNNFVPCEQNGCSGGWIKVFSGQTEGGRLVDENTGAAKPCQCLLDYRAGNVSLRPAYSRFGKGYNDRDMLWLYHRLTLRKKLVGNQPLTKADYESLLDELDARRGGPPEWRQS